ncbi:phenylalanyl-trna synthetase beta [Cystoisospora suis]|uniref:Phenylalanyl-trna synthetase beta n=1 Tax=Cystoisospora suis TaxID=483139 RepID=A0A2C6LCC9_9APIC|nr:phenylalanyl-trna synthetase beta [Cystoisospora suis]
MHQCDIAEDVAIAYGYGNLPVHRSHILPLNLLNSFSDKVRNFFSTCGYNEALTFLLISSAENYTNLGKKIPSIPSSSASATPLESLLQDALLSVNPCEYQLSPLPVRLMNSKTREFEHARTSLIPGILKSICANKGLTELPMKLFEVGDVCLIDRSTEVGARNLRYCCAAYADEHSSGLEEIHGVLDGLMKSLNFVAEYTIAEMESAVATAVAKGTKAGGGAEETGKKKKEEDESLAAHHLPQTEQLQRTLERMQGTYKLVPSKEAIFLPGRQVHILASRKPTATDGSEEIPLLIGVFGILHPHTLKAFNLHLPVSVLELNLEAFTKWLPAIDLMGN